MNIYEKFEDGLKIEFIYSPLFEMLCSLHVLTRPEHHLERLGWARDMHAKMSPKLYDELMYFGINFFEWCSAMDFDRYSENVNDLNIISALEAIQQVDIDEFIYTMLGEKVTREDVKRCLKKGNAGELNIPREQKNIFIDSQDFRRRMISCLKEYYYMHFEKELRFIEPLLIRILRRQAELYDSSGIREYAGTLHNRIEVGDEALYFHKYTKFTVPFTDLKKVIIMPSSFIDPHLLIGIKDNGSLNLTIRAHLTEMVQEIPLDLYKTMKALGDDTRLRILRSISRNDSSTQSLSRELGLTEACISKHLKILHEADILYKERKGNYIYYILNRMTLDRIPMDMYQYFDGGMIREIPAAVQSKDAS